MIHSIGIKELATEKTLSVDPTDLGVRIFMYNKALEERMHIELDLDDMIAVNKVLEKRIKDLGGAKPMIKSTILSFSVHDSQGNEILRER